MSGLRGLGDGTASFPPLPYPVISCIECLANDLHLLPKSEECEEEVVCICKKYMSAVSLGHQVRKRELQAPALVIYLPIR